jgi:2-oxoglutarate ferredoxin oxidoreductase subunit alpha
MTPVILLTDGYIANGAEPWRFPEAKDLKPITPPFAKPKVAGDMEKFLPYLRDENGVRPWAIPGMAGLQHRIGGIEKEDGTGNISYEPLNHEKMVRLRADKVRKVVEGVPPLDLSNGVDSGDLLILGWGSTYGAIKTAVNEMCAEGHCVGHLHLRYLFPFRKELGEIISRYKRVLIPEMNSGQMRQLIRAEFLVDARGLNKIQGMPFTAAEIKVAATEFLKQ